MESAYTKTVYFNIFDDNVDIHKKLSAIPGMIGLKFENNLAKIKRDLETIGRSSISYVQHGYGVTSQYDHDDQQIQRLRMQMNNDYGMDSLLASTFPIKIKITEEETNKKLLLL